MTAIAVWALVKRFWWALPIVLGLLYVGHRIYDMGVHSRDKEVAKLTDAYKSWRTYGEAEAKLVADGRKAHAQALQGLQKDQQTIVAGLTKRLDAAEAQARKTRITPKEVIRYVSHHADATYRVPFGFLRLHNAALAAEGSPEAAAVPGGGQPDADAASDTPLSTVGATVADNYAECLARGEVIKAWQDWYPKMKDAWQRAVQVQLTSPDTLPDTPK